MKRAFLLTVLLGAGASSASPAIKVNTLGFPPGAHKLALVPAGAADRFELVREDAGGSVAYRGTLGPPARWDASGDSVRVADFSALVTPGRYRLRVAGLAPSDSFTIGTGVYQALGAAALKAFYFNRSGTALAAKHAGAYARPAGHLDDRVLVHTSAASDARPAGTVIAAPRGWYDAGDYNKYLPSAAISTYTLLAALEDFPAQFVRDIGIPESGDAVPDILDEAMWNLDWMLAMQDPHDGGVYPKLTNLVFDKMVMPHEAMRAPRYVVAKSTAAALGFAATMASASRVLARHKARWPGMSARMLEAAERAWTWALAHPAAHFKNPPDVVTGEYGDAHLDDEWAWAAAELYIATGKDGYYTALRPEALADSVPTWDDVRGLAWMSLARHRARLTPAADRELIASRVEELAARLARHWRDSPYRLATRGQELVWGSNAVVLNGAMMLLQGYRLRPNPEWLAAAQSGLDYVLGRNALGRSQVTGFGARPPLHPHHRPSAGDRVAAPVPGFVVGGPQPFQQDKAECPPYPSPLPALSYLDHVCSYASNEVAINWNAPLVYVTAALQALTPASKGTAMQDAPTPQDLLREEESLRFDRFGEPEAAALGATLVAAARRQDRPVTVAIHRIANQHGGAPLFVHAMEGAPADHLDWIRRKNNVVARTGHSSFYLHSQVLAAGGDIDAVPGFDPRDYAAHGGAFPIVVKGAGLVGTVTVSGLPGPEDHALAVGAVRAYLSDGPAPKAEGQLAGGGR